MPFRPRIYVDSNQISVPFHYVTYYILITGSQSCLTGRQQRRRYIFDNKFDHAEFGTMDTIVTLGRPSVVPSVVAAGVGTTSLLYILYKRWINDIRVPESFPEAYDLREVLKIIKKINLLVSNSWFSRRPYISVSFYRMAQLSSRRCQDKKIAQLR